MPKSEPSTHVPLSVAQEPNWLTRATARFGEPKIGIQGHRMPGRDDDGFGRVTRWVWVWFPTNGGKPMNHSVKIDLCEGVSLVWRVHVRSHDMTKPQMEWLCRREPSDDDIETLLLASRFLEVDDDGADT